MLRLSLKEDMHIHSVFSDGRATLDEIYEEAEAVGLEQICFVDHVRADTDWLPSFVEAADAYRGRPGPRVFVGVEAKILDTAGRLDLPELPPGINHILAADHQVPFPDGPRDPRQVREAIAAGTYTRRLIISQIVKSTVECMRRHPGVIVAHLFSILRKLRIDEAWVTREEVLRLGRVALETGSRFEISERWSCPSPRVAKLLAVTGADIHLSTDSHSREKIGRYRYCKELAQLLSQ